MNKERREKPYFLRRLVAYLIDLIIVILLSGILSLIFIKNDNYESETKKLIELTAKYTQGTITQEEFSQESDNINYYLTKESVGITIINIGVEIVYYVVLCFYCGGITLGKYLMKLRIASANEKELNLGHFLLRALLVNLILINIVSVLMVLLFNKDTFISIYPKISNVLTILLLVTLVVIMYREDGRGLHDILSRTVVVSTKKQKDINEEITEAKVIEEKKNTKRKGIKNERIK